MKKFLHILIAISIFFNSGGFLFTFFTLKHLIKEQVFIQLKKDISSFAEIEHFKIKKTDLHNNNSGSIQWKNEDEFLFNEHMYDVVLIRDDQGNPGYSIIYAVNDIKEDKLLKSFSKLLDDLINGNTTNPKLRTILNNLISCALVDAVFNFNSYYHNYVILKSNSIKILSFFIKPVSPPPKSE